MIKLRVRPARFQHEQDHACRPDSDRGAWADGVPCQAADRVSLAVRGDLASGVVTVIRNARCVVDVRSASRCRKIECRPILLPKSTNGSTKPVAWQSGLLAPVSYGASFWDLKQPSRIQASPTSEKLAPQAAVARVDLSNPKDLIDGRINRFCRVNLMIGAIS